jgi:carboxyl-terminal processing protease
MISVVIQMSNNFGKAALRLFSREHMKHWMVVPLFVGFMCFGLLRIEAQDFSESARQADFKIFIQKFKDNYAYRDRIDKPWETWESRYSAAVDSASSPEAFAAVLESALDELHDFHAQVRSHNPHRWLPVPTFADIWAEFRGEDAVVVAVRRGSDAERAGIVPGDRVTHIGEDALPVAISARLTTAVDRDNPSARAWALLSLLTGRADEERHFTIVDKNKQSRSVTLQVQRQFDRSAGVLSSTVLPENIGLIRFNNSLGDQKTVAAFDAALEQLRNTRGLILDLRDVPSGGDSSVALGIMGRLITTMLPYQRHRIPHYGQKDVERNWIEQVSPRGPFTFEAPVVVLVDHWTGSMGEGMAIGFDSMHRALVIGTRMAGLAGAVSDFRLPQTGIDVAFATEQLYHVNGTARQLWVPPILVDEANPGGADLIQMRALSELKRMIASAGSKNPKK